MKKDDLPIQYADDVAEPFFDVGVISITILMGCVFVIGYWAGKVFG